MANRARKSDVALTLQQLQTFRMVAITGSFIRAAAALGYSQSNVTHQIKSLEEKLGSILLDRYRSSKRAVLTEAGRRALEYAERILDLAHSLLSKDKAQAGS